MSHRARTLWIAIAAWHLACLAMMIVFRDVIAQFVVAAYTACFGNIQASYGSFDRLATYLAIVVITSPASLVSLILFDRLSHGSAKRKRMLVTFAAWQLVVIAVLVWSYEIGFPYMVNQIGWALFGPPEDIYSFQNLVLHRIIAWMLCTTPVAWIVLWGYSRWGGHYFAKYSMQNGDRVGTSGDRQ